MKMFCSITLRFQWCDHTPLKLFNGIKEQFSCSVEKAHSVVIQIFKLYIYTYGDFI
jgi:hypothetical protein